MAIPGGPWVSLVVNFFHCIYFTFYFEQAVQKHELFT